MASICKHSLKSLTICTLTQDSLIRQSLECSLIPYMLKLLEHRMEFTDNPSMVSQETVKVKYNFVYF